ncbi:hypothetical protein [Flavobacterium noncentrifugens]|uniref:hypothetical protein n=1 Tax=Flavobacterium noncentrifugens TaxID=1128970 RepID=UPI001114044B|nr:hypothetical protein [Flavobacterium noncentrifugens]
MKIFENVSFKLARLLIVFKFAHIILEASDDLVNFVEDETMDAGEAISQFEIRVTDQGVVFGGRLATAAMTRQFIVAQTATEYYVSFQNISLVVPVPAALFMEDVALQLDGDAAPDSK